ncbi:hypothetical protein ACE6ED_09685 [Paenibacillus sp. CN-4]|uniref:hypothetical protein n=1 Tax=Paenibacillus nanchangensis TaxID=3348343 RepID=UPI00397BA9AF
MPVSRQAKTVMPASKRGSSCLPEAETLMLVSQQAVTVMLVLVSRQAKTSAGRARRPRPRQSGRPAKQAGIVCYAIVLLRAILPADTAAGPAAAFLTAAIRLPSGS